MNARDRAFVVRKFSEYYEKAELNVSSVQQREFGIGNAKKIDARHLSFASRDELRRYLVSNTPLFLSHSASYYNFPDATPMDRKGWLGADLIFDFDAHAEGKYEVYCKLEETKNDTLRLVNDFLVEDFGIAKKDIKIVFSGNRGYHVHVSDPHFLDLGGDERREITDYVRGMGLNHRNFFESDSYRRGKYHGPGISEAGYRGRFVRETIRVLTEKPSSISRIFSNEKRRTDFIEAIKIGNWEKSSLNHDDLMERLEPIAKSLGVHSVDADAGVSYDVSKLIRAPGSLHGDTGFVAKVVDDLYSFEPLKDAVLPSKAALKVQFTEDVPAIGLAGAEYSFKKDETKELPEWVAIFFVLKGSATFL